MFEQHKYWPMYSNIFRIMLEYWSRIRVRRVIALQVQVRVCLCRREGTANMCLIPLLYCCCKHAAWHTDSCANSAATIATLQLIYLTPTVLTATFSVTPKQWLQLVAKPSCSCQAVYCIIMICNLKPVSLLAVSRHWPDSDIAGTVKRIH